MNVPTELIYPTQVFAEEFKQRAEEGLERMLNAKVVFVGLARNCADKLAVNLARLEHLVEKAGEWALHIESNDCTDSTLDVLHGFTSDHPQATFHYSVLGRRQFVAEFSGPRTIAMAEYRDACQRWVRACHSDADYVVGIDFDQWGGWSEVGVFNGIGWLVELQAAYAMASVSLMQHKVVVSDGKGSREADAWLHYDCWALRGIGQPSNYWDDYSVGHGGWKHHYMPPVGSPPVLAASGFGGLCIYRTGPYLAGTYDGTNDCEHVPFHKSIAKETGQFLYLNPSQRCVMHWMEDTDARQHGDN